MLHTTHLQLAYGKRIIIEDLSIQGLVPGTVTALLGPNGSGKSTLLKALAGLLPIQAGHIVLNGQNLAQCSPAERARQLVYLPQSLPAEVHLRVMESVLVAANASRLGNEQTNLTTILELLDRLGIGGLAMHYLDQLSGGQKQLVGLAQALIRHPRLLLLDEPLSALDLNYQFHVMNLLRQVTRDQGLITLIVLHDLNIALRHSDHALLIQHGTLLAQGRPEVVITTETLAQAYGVKARIEPCSRGTLRVLIDGLHATHHA
ncbi:ABC transporter ATP-binding protein [Alcaligenaceae bacterium CGII-47]|nr:ABC transporter ATP-binding protein [Alcaligenaceae bacterium CGII-47]